MKIFMIASFLLVVSLVMQASKAAETSGVSHKKICAAGIAATMGKPASIMNSTEAGGGVVTVSYERPSDGSLWSYKCKVSGNMIVWGNLDGRWRTGPDDSVITFMVSGINIVVREEYPDGSAGKNEYKLNQLGK